jgi:hypothetical protein
MRAATIDRRGQVSIREVPVPAVGRREVRFAVGTSGVGSWDPAMRPEGKERLVVPGTDGAGIVKTSDLVTWTPVLRYQDLTEAVTCPAGTVQHDECAATWCAVCTQLGCKPSPSYGCPAAPADVDTGDPPSRKGGGCCSAGPGAAGALALALSVATVILRPRRRRVPPGPPGRR